MATDGRPSPAKPAGTSSGGRTRPGRRGGLGWRPLVAAAAIGLAASACQPGAQQGPAVTAVDAVMPAGGVAAERAVDGVTVRTVVSDVEVCMTVVTPATPRVGGSAAEGGGGCGPVEHLGRTLERDGTWSVVTASHGWTVFAGLVADGYDSARSADGRRWEIVDNLLVIVQHDSDTGDVAPWPEAVQLEGAAGRRQIEVAEAAP